MIHLANIDYKHRIIFMKAASLVIQDVMPYRARIQWKRDGLRQPEYKYTEVARDDELFREACLVFSELMQKYL